MKNYCYLLLFVNLVLLTACNNSSNESTDQPSQASATADYDQIGKAFCACAASSINLNEKMQQLSSEGKRDEFVKMAGQVGEEFKNALNCCLEKKEGLTTATLDSETLLAAIRNQCPAIPDKLSAQLAEKVK